MLPSSEVHLELLYILHGAERGGAVAGCEVVSVARNVTDETCIQVGCDAPVEECLVVEKIGVVFSFCVQ